ncbi:unnamed protein product [Phyllotreta striolata]|uniref:Uncharacterized protein n=1 Tax=Phyllotreta striolata TaxID=444603 RepID=A0A9N9XLK6_PHYSR|nr:unnamed protein product [Phyllotreta striolata]
MPKNPCKGCNICKKTRPKSPCQTQKKPKSPPCPKPSSPSCPKASPSPCQCPPPPPCKCPPPPPCPAPPASPAPPKPKDSGSSCCDCDCGVSGGGGGGIMWKIFNVSNIVYLGLTGACIYVYDQNQEFFRENFKKIQDKINEYKKK